MTRVLLLFVVLLISAPLSGQTCCTAGAPISSNLEISNSDINSLSLQFTYEYKSINLLIDDNRRLVNDPRSRFGQNAAVKLDYVISKKWAASVTLPLVHQSRSTVSSTQSSIGIGDLSVLGQYQFYSDQRNAVNLSGGIKLPIGKVNHRDPSSIFLSPDMQSGSGSFDYFARASYNRVGFLLPFLSTNLSAVYRRNGINDSFGSTDTFQGRRFAFGDNAIFNLSFRYLIDFRKGFLIPDAALQYRWGGPNREEQTIAPNSGGNWLSIPAGFTYDIDGEKSIRLYGELPIYQKLDGLQITTDFVVGVQLSYIFKKKNSQNIIEF